MKLWRFGQPIEHLGRRYRLDGVLGSGGMADVCLAWDERERREVALKILKSDDLDQETLNRFMKEAAQIAHWQHPHILRVYESLQVELIDAASGSVLFYMVSEYARGGDLQKRLTPGRSFPLSATFALFRQLCDAVQYAHERGVIHRDLKPLNMLFRRPESGPEEVVLSDFGLAVQVDASHHTFAHGGTLAYMAPEQFQGHAQPASDIFALGVILYLLCTGYLPFRRSFQDIPRLVLGEAPTPTRPSLLNPELPSALDEVMLQALRTLPAERYRQPREFWEAIELVLTTNARTFPFVEEFWQNAGQTWPYDGSEPPQRSRQADQQRQSADAPSPQLDEEAREAEEGPAPVQWIAREKQKASPVRPPFPTNSIPMSPNLSDADASEQMLPAHDMLSTPQAGASVPSIRRASAVRPAASASGSTILPAPRTRARDLEQTSRRRQPLEPFDPSDEAEGQTSRRQPTHQLPDESERESSRRQPFERFEPDPLSLNIPARQSSRRRLSEYDSYGGVTASASQAVGTAADEEYRSPSAQVHPSRRRQSASHRAASPPRTSTNTTSRRPSGAVPRSRVSTPHSSGTRRRPLLVMLCGLALLGLLLAIFAATSFQGALLTFFGAPVTRVSLQPRSQIVQTTATLKPRTDGGQLTADQIPGRQLTVTTSTQSATANASGSIRAKQATGQLTFINNGSTDVTIQSTVITDNDGIQISFQGPITIPAAPPSSTIVTGFALQVGIEGNIPILDIVKQCCAPNIVVKNTSAFTGGQDAQQNSVIQQKDIDGAAKPLETSEGEQAQADLRAQMRPDERVAGNAQCQPQISANQQVGALAKQVTVQVTEICRETVYDYNAARHSLTQDLQRSASTDPTLGAAYVLTGQITLSLIATTPGSGNVVLGPALEFHAQGLWRYQFKPTALHDFATQIAGKSQDAARALLLRQPGIVAVQFSTTGPLPVNTSEIQISVQPPSSTPS